MTERQEQTGGGEAKSNRGNKGREREGQTGKACHKSPEGKVS